MQFYNYDNLSVEYLNLSGNQFSTESARLLAKFLKAGKMKYLNTLIVHDCPNLSTADLQEIQIAASPLGIKVLDNNIKKVKEERIQSIGKRFFDMYSKEFKRQIGAFRE